MKFIVEDDLINLTKKEARETKKKRAIIADMYGSGIVVNGERLTPVFDTVEELLAWNHTEDYFEYKVLDSILSVCSDSTSLEKSEVVKKLQNTEYFGDFFKNVKEAVDSVKNYFGSRIEEIQRNKMISDAKKVDVNDTVLIRMPGDENVCDSILYLVSNDQLAENVIDLLRKDESISGRNEIYYANFVKQKTNE